jgi:SAM-dependent methyltransferase
MNDRARERILDNARYLRNVRPIDPEEIYGYVESQPHPGIVRQVLREEAFDLGLVERPDGTFEPVGEDPVAPSFSGVERFPVEYGRRLADLLVEAFGSDWHRGDSGERLREVVRRTKEAYLRGSAVEYDEETALGYAVYHLPDYYAAIQYLLDELGSQGLLPRTLRVLDVGAGTGGPALGLFDYLGDDALVDYHAVEPSDAASVLAGMLSEAPRNVHTTVHRETAESFEPNGPYDLVLFANVLSELDDPTAVVERYLDAVADDGTLAALAPADLETSTGLRDVERALDDRAEMFSPTLRLWPGESPSDRGWSFAVRPDLEAPPVQHKLDDGSGEFVNVDVQYSHFLLRPDGRRRLDVRADPARHAKMAEMDDHVTERVDLLAVKLSENLAEADANPLFKVSDGSEQVGNFAVLTKRTALNRDLLAAEYGDVLVFEGALVLWNDDEEAYNLVVDDETVVDRVPTP